MQEKLEAFRQRVKSEGNTVAFLGNIDNLKYKVSQSLKNARNYASEDAGWVRYSDMTEIINQKVNQTNLEKLQYSKEQEDKLAKIEEALKQLSRDFEDVKTNQLTWQEVETVTKDDISNLFEVRGETLIINPPKEKE